MSLLLTISGWLAEIRMNMWLGRVGSWVAQSAKVVIKYSGLRDDLMPL